MTAVASCENFGDTYRRQARRLRATYWRSPVQLQQALRSLASHTDRVKPVIGDSKDEVKHFAAEVVASLDGSVLRYSARQRLIQQAARLGIRRFDANLLIAAVQHRLQGESTLPAFLPPVRTLNRMRWVVPTCAVVLLQSLICSGFYLLLRRFY